MKVCVDCKYYIHDRDMPTINSRCNYGAITEYCLITGKETIKIETCCHNRYSSDICGEDAKNFKLKLSFWERWFR